MLRSKAKKFFFKVFFLDYPFVEDAILAQERFEPTEWAESLEVQIDKLKRFLPNIQVNEQYIESKSGKLSKNFHRVVVPKFEYLQKIVNASDPYNEIGLLIEFACKLLSHERDGKFTHYREGQLGLNRIKIIPELANRRKKIETRVEGDVLVLDVDLGNKFAGWTPRRARERIIRSKKYLALSSVDLCWILLLNPGRLQTNVDLSVDSVMEEYLSEDRGWVTNLFFYFRGGKLEFGYRWNRRAYFDCGAAIAKMS